MNSYFSAIRKAFTFGGRASRSEYWWFTLFFFLLGIVATVVDLAIDPNSTEPGIVTALVVLVHLIPTLSVGVRRLHDIGRGGWWLLIGLVPLIGLITLVVFALSGSQAGENRFGPSPFPNQSTKPAPTTMGASAPNSATVLDQVQKLAALRDSGALSKDEYEKLKSEALGKANG